MNVIRWLSLGAMLALGGCGSFSQMGADASNPFIQELPDGVLYIVAPFQDLDAVLLDPIDSCYVYRHVGRVEATFLPLRSIDGRPICVRPAA